MPKLTIDDKTGEHEYTFDGIEIAHLRDVVSVARMVSAQIDGMLRALGDHTCTECSDDQREMELTEWLDWW